MPVTRTASLKHVRKQAHASDRCSASLSRTGLSMLVLGFGSTCAAATPLWGAVMRSFMLEFAVGFTRYNVSFLSERLSAARGSCFRRLVRATSLKRLNPLCGASQYAR